MTPRAKSSFSSAHNIPVPTLSEMKKVAKELKKSLNLRKRDVTLADCLEGMSAAFGFKNYATYKAMAEKESQRVCLKTEDFSQMTPLFYLAEGMIGDIDPEETNGSIFIDPREFKNLSLENIGDGYKTRIKAMMERGEEAELSALGGSWAFSEFVEQFAVVTKEDRDLTEQDCQQMVVTEVFALGPRFDKYGTPWYADESACGSRILENFNFRVSENIFANCSDSGDDGSGYTVFKVMVPKEIAEKILKS